MAKILIADDEADILSFLEKFLKAEGFKIIKARNGLEVMEKVEKEKPDIAILDIMMPYLNGMEVLQKLKTNPATKNLPVIMLTIKSSGQDILKGYKYGADYYIPKPFEIRNVIIGVRMMLKERGGKEEKYKISED